MTLHVSGLGIAGTLTKWDVNISHVVLEQSAGECAWRNDKRDSIGTMDNRTYPPFLSFQTRYTSFTCGKRPCSESIPGGDCRVMELGSFGCTVVITRLPH